MVSPAATGFLIQLTKGQPPNMTASQKVVITEVMMHWAAMGGGGAAPAPAAKKCTDATTAPTARETRISSKPLAGCGRAPAKAGWFVPQVMPMTTSIGIKQMVQYATQLMKVAPAKSEMKPRATAITRREAITPKAGCFISPAPV